MAFPLSSASNLLEPRPELFFGLVAAIGTDLKLVSEILAEALSDAKYNCEHIKLSELIDEGDTPRDAYARYLARMAAGTKLRNNMQRGDALVLMGLGDIWTRRRKLDPTAGPVPRVVPSTAYIFNQLKHPDEVSTLRKVYGNSFFLISGYSPRERRVKHLSDIIARSRNELKSEKFRKLAEELIEKDKNEEGESLGQQVQDTFPEADVFINVDSPESVRASITRFVELLFGHPFHTPTRDEFSMFQARAAALRSSDLGRQVGAVIATTGGDIVSVGTNEVPCAGGGQYWAGDDPDLRDFRRGQDSNSEVKKNFLRDLLQRLSDNDGWLNANKTSKDIDQLVDQTFSKGKSFLTGAQLMSLIAYFRAVHAEMSCITDAARRGVATRGHTLVCTTFPCHECARHIVAAGLSRVIYIDPYPKSLTPDLYPDSIVVDPDVHSKSHVSFESFVGIAPRLYLSLFDASKIARKDETGAVVKWIPSNSSPRLSEDPKSYVTKESFLNKLMNDFSEVEDTRTRKEENTHEKARSDSTGVRSSSGGSKKSSGMDAGVGTTKRSKESKGRKSTKVQQSATVRKKTKR